MTLRPSPLERVRAAFEPRVPGILRAPAHELSVEAGRTTAAAGDPDQIRQAFPHTYGRPLLRLVPGTPTEPRPLTVGVVLSGGQAPGGHNVIAGLHDALKRNHDGSRLLGFVGGPRGVVHGDVRELTAEVLAPFRNTGGFDLIGSGRDKIESPAQLEASRSTCEKLGLDGLVIVGGDDSNTNAAVLAEHFKQQDVAVSVVGVPKTIDGDLKGEQLEISFGFDTATKVYAELVGNICRDARSSAKYWHFVKLMGRSASHVALECALTTCPNIALIGEEIRERALTLQQVVDLVAEVVRRRARAGKHYGVCLIPEGLIEFIPDMGRLFAELNRILARYAAEIEELDSVDEKRGFVAGKLKDSGLAVFESLPVVIQRQLLVDRDSHGNVQVSKIDTQLLLEERVAERVEAWRRAGEFPGSFRVQGHFLGYEGRCAAPSDFDASYTYALGGLAGVLIALGRTGYLCAIGNLVAAPEAWLPLGLPLTSMMRLEHRKGRPVPVIAKALVPLGGRPFAVYSAERDRWAGDDHYRYPGAIQYFGPAQVRAAPTRTLLLEQTGSGAPPPWLDEEDAR